MTRSLEAAHLAEGAVGRCGENDATLVRPHVCRGRRLHSHRRTPVGPRSQILPRKIWRTDDHTPGVALDFSFRLAQPW